MSATVDLVDATDVILRDGSTLRLRPPVADDADALLDFFSGLSEHSLYLRFHGFTAVGPTLVEAVLEPDWQERGSLLGSLDGSVVALANWVRLRDPRAAEVAFAVGDGYQRRGIGTRLLEQLAAPGGRGRGRGVRRRGAARERRHARRLPRRRLRRGARGRRRRGRDPVPDRAHQRISRAGRDSRPRRGARLARALLPAALGCGRRRFEAPRLDRWRALPQRPLRGLRRRPSTRSIAAATRSPVYAVTARWERSPRTSTWPSSACRATRFSAPPRMRSPSAFARSSSSPPASPRRAAKEPSGSSGCWRSPASTARACSARTASESRPPPFASTPPSRRAASRPARSASPLRAARSVWRCSRRAEATGLGVTSFVSVGNKADVSSNDLLEWWEDDDDTEMVVLYLESFGNPRAFSRIARRLARRKPILALKGGSTGAGSRAAGSHTAALAGSDVAVDALFRQAGVIRARTLDELIDVATLLSAQPVPRGRASRARHERRRARDPRRGRVRVRRARAAFSRASRRERRWPRSCRPRDRARNPIDLLGGATAESFAAALPLVLADPAFDAVIALFVPTVGTNEEEVGAAISRAAATAVDKPVLCTFVSAKGAPASLRSAGRGSRVRVSRGGSARARTCGGARRVAATAGRDNARARLRPRRGADGRRRGRRNRRRLARLPSRRVACSRRTASRSFPSGWRRRPRRPWRRPRARLPGRAQDRDSRRAQDRARRRRPRPRRRRGCPRGRGANRDAGARAAVRARRRRAAGRRGAGSGLRPARGVRPRRRPRRADRRGAVQACAAHRPRCRGARSLGQGGTSRGRLQGHACRRRGRARRSPPAPFASGRRPAGSRGARPESRARATRPLPRRRRQGPRDGARLRPTARRAGSASAVSRR